MEHESVTPTPVSRQEGGSASGRNTPVVHLAIDDVHPDLTGDDFGSLDRRKSGVEPFLSIARRYPWLKVVLFVTAGWRFRGRDAPWPARRFSLSQQGKWCAALADALPENVCIGLHGLEHFNARNHDAPWAEFEHTNATESRRRIEKMLWEFDAASIPYERVFRPPGWSVSDECLEVLREVGVRTVCASYDIHTEPRPSSRSSRQGLLDISLLAPTKLANGVVNVPANYDIGWSEHSRALSIVAAGGCLGITGHVAAACYGTPLGTGPLSSALTRLEHLLDELQDLHEDNRLLSMWPQELLPPSARSE